MAYTWTDDPLVANQTHIRKIHIDELRDAINDLDSRVDTLESSSSGGGTRAVYHVRNGTDDWTYSFDFFTPNYCYLFGDLSYPPISYPAATSNGTNNRGVFGGGSANNGDNTIVYFSFTHSGSTIDFGDLTIGRYFLSATSNGTNNRGVFAGGVSSSVTTYYSRIDYITINTPSDAVFFGNLTTVRCNLAATSNGTNNRGVFAGGYVISYPTKTYIDYITINSPSNASDFGNLQNRREDAAAASNGTNNRGVFAGGYDYYDGIVGELEYINITIPSNASYFGSLSIDRRGMMGVGYGPYDKVYFAYGSDGLVIVKQMDIVNIMIDSTSETILSLTTLLKEAAGRSAAANV